MPVPVPVPVRNTERILQAGRRVLGSLARNLYDLGRWVGFATASLWRYLGVGFDASRILEGFN